jgi:serine/threonine protein kinase
MLFKSNDADAELMIADFGLSKIVQEEATELLLTTCGTPGYMSPGPYGL